MAEQTSEQKSAVAATAAVRHALDRTASALASADLEALLAAESALAAALRQLPAAAARGEQANLLRQEILAARAASLRCARLGASLSHLVRISLDARGGSITYEPAYEPAHGTAVALAGRGFSARV